MHGPEHAAWLAQVEEEILEPERLVIDPHHHLWRFSPQATYWLISFGRIQPPAIISPGPCLSNVARLTMKTDLTI